MRLNEQQPEKRVDGHANNYAVNSIFHTIQGEGPFAGTPAVFVRLAGCNLQCPMCDTEYTERTEMTAEEITQAVHDARPSWQSNPHGPFDCHAPTTLVVITGGEPFRQPIGHLARVLLKTGYKVQVETNGTLFQHDFPWFDERASIVCSPKTGSVHREMLPAIVAWKYVATAGSLEASEDGLPLHALGHAAHPRLYRPPAGHDAPVYLQPVDMQNPADNAANLAAVVASCLKHGYRLCLQLHKIAGVP